MYQPTNHAQTKLRYRRRKYDSKLVKTRPLTEDEVMLVRASLREAIQSGSCFVYDPRNDADLDRSLIANESRHGSFPGRVP